MSLSSWLAAQQACSVAAVVVFAAVVVVVVAAVAAVAAAVAAPMHERQLQTMQGCAIFILQNAPWKW